MRRPAHGPDREKEHDCCVFEAKCNNMVKKEQQFWYLISKIPLAGSIYTGKPIMYDN